MKTANPTVFPREGIYVRPGIHIDLECMTEGAHIRYTMDGSDPKVNGISYNRDNGLISLPDVPPEKEQPTEKMVELKAVAEKEGFEPSDVVTFHYTIRRRPETSYISQLIRPLSEKQPGIVKLFDADDDNIYLIVGSERALVIDAGVYDSGDLPGYVKGLIGEKPVDLVLTHGHLDHYMQAWNFAKAGIPVWLNHRDLPIAMHFSGHDLSFTKEIPEGKTFDVGNAVYECFTVAGHSSAGTILYDRKNGDAFTGDAVGSTGSLAPDSQLLHLGNPEGVLDIYFPTLVQFIRKAGPELQHIYTGHNDNVLCASVFLTTVERMLQNAIDHGAEALKPALRPLSDGITSSPHVLYTGNYRAGEDWACINIEKLFSNGLNSENIALLADLWITGGSLQQPFDPHVYNYTWLPENDKPCYLYVRPMSTRIAGLKINGKEATACRPVKLDGSCKIEVTAPNDWNTAVYRLTRK